MPTQEQLRMWLEQVATAAAPFGEGASVAMGLPDISCAYLLALINRLLRRIAMDTAITGMTAAEAQSYRDLQVLHARIARACDPTQQPETPPEPEPAPETEPEPTPAQPEPTLVQPEPPLQPVAPIPPSPPSCCDLHGHQLPSLDFRNIALSASAAGVRVGGSVVSEHPCGFAYWSVKVVVVDARGVRSEIYRSVSRVGSASKRLQIDLPSSLLRGFRSGYVEFETESNCGTSNRAIRSNHGWVIRPDSPTYP
jgi:hypothetical protein